jgi:hypothetical protein
VAPASRFPALFSILAESSFQSGIRLRDDTDAPAVPVDHWKYAGSDVPASRARIEEITSAYVVLRIWDLRRLICR